MYNYIQDPHPLRPTVLADVVPHTQHGAWVKERRSGSFNSNIIQNCRLQCYRWWGGDGYAADCVDVVATRPTCVRTRRWGATICSHTFHCGRLSIIASKSLISTSKRYLHTHIDTRTSWPGTHDPRCTMQMFVFNTFRNQLSFRI